MIAQERIDEIAKDAVVEAVRDLAHDRMGQGELLEDEDGWDDLAYREQDAECDRLETAIKPYLPEAAGLAALLTAIQAADTNYEQRYPLVLRALATAAQLGYPAGIALDLADPEWPVVYIELPDHGQISWHMPAHTIPFDGHTTEQKYDRCRAYAEDNQQ